MGYTISEIKAANKAHGWYFFEKGTMRFFKSRILPRVYAGRGGIYFVTRETDPSGKTAFTVRQFCPITGDINTVGDFHELTLPEARDAAQQKSREAKSND